MSRQAFEDAVIRAGGHVGRPCQHPQAEPVILCTGELVACMCIGCFSPLPADYIERQVEAARVKACCPHPDLCIVCG